MSLNKLFNFIVAFFKKLILSVWNYDLLKIIKIIKEVKFIKEISIVLLLLSIIIFTTFYYAINNPSYHAFNCGGIQEFEKEKYEWNKDLSDPKIIPSSKKSINNIKVKFHYKSYFLNVMPAEASYEFTDGDKQDINGHYFTNSKNESCHLNMKNLKCGYYLVFSSKQYLNREHGNIFFNKTTFELERFYGSEYITDERKNWSTGLRDLGDYNVRFIDKLKCSPNAGIN